MNDSLHQIQTGFKCAVEALKGSLQGIVDHAASTMTGRRRLLSTEGSPNVGAYAVVKDNEGKIQPILTKFCSMVKGFVDPVRPLSSSAHTVRGAAVRHASCRLFFDEQLVLYNFTPNSPAWQAAVYFLPGDMLRT